MRPTGDLKGILSTSKSSAVSKGRKEVFGMGLLCLEALYEVYFALNVLLGRLCYQMYTSKMKRVLLWEKSFGILV